MRHPAVILRRSVKSLLRHSNFSILKDGARRYLGFSNVGILGLGRVKRVKMRYCAKFRCDRSSPC